MARIYISSTFEDLRTCRAKVAATLRRMDHTDVAMENYGAQDSRPLEQCLADVAACDLYICLVAWRYGFVPDGQEFSITELEYQHAVDLGKPRLAFLLAEDAPWPMSHIEISAMGRVGAFRQKLGEDRIIAHFRGEDDLAGAVSEAISKWERREGRTPAGGRADWESYRRAVADTHRWVRLAVIAGAKQDSRSAAIPLTEVFVPQPVRTGPPEFEVPEDPPAKDLRTDLIEDADSIEHDKPELEVEILADGTDELAGASSENSLDVIGRERLQVFLGVPGSGKSTLLIDAMLLLCDTAADPGSTTVPAGLRAAPVPFLLELRQYVLDPATTFVNYLASSATRLYGVDIDAQSVHALLSTHGRAIVMFDGLDEVFDQNVKGHVIEEFRSFARRYSGTQLVVTSRVAGYPGLELERDGFRHYTLLGFDMPQIREFVPKWYTYYTVQGDLRDAGGLIRRIIESPRLYELARNPLLLTMMAVIYKHHDLPEKRWQLYARCTEVLLEDWDVKRKKIERNQLLSLGFVMTAEQKSELLQNVSMYMLEQKRTGAELNAIAREPLLSILTTYLVRTYGKSAGEARAVATEILDHLRERTYIIAEIGDQLFGFVHRTFMEFFAAGRCRAEFNRREADYQWLVHELFGARWRQDEWREVLLLLIAMLKDQGSPVRKVIDHLRKEKVPGLPVQLAFAARCLAESATVDDTWSRSIVSQLATAICTAAGQTTNATNRAFIEDALGSFTVLASTVAISAATRKKIDRLSSSSSSSLRGRMVGFQLQLALRSKEERLTFALEAFSDSSEAVRRGAIAAVEREWPGREQAAEALLQVLRYERRARVRLAALQALERSWPTEAAVLEALDSRARSETAYTFAVEVIWYLSRRWSGDRRALQTLVRLCERDNASGADWQVVHVAAVYAIVDGWGQAEWCKRELQSQWHAAESPMVAAVAFAALHLGWSREPDTLDWLEQRMRKPDRLDDRGRTLILLLKTSHDEREMVEKAKRRAVEDADAEVRVNLLSAIPASPEDTATRGWFGERSVADPDQWVRVRALERWVEVQPPGADSGVMLRDRAVRDDSAAVRQQALRSITISREHDVDFLRSRLRSDDHPAVRMTVLWLLALDAARKQADSSQDFALMQYLDPNSWSIDSFDTFAISLWDYVYFVAGRRSNRVREQHPDSFDFIVVALRDTSADVRRYALALLVMCAPERVFRQEVDRLLQHETDPDVRYVAEQISGAR